MTTANDLCHTVAKHSLPFSFNSNTSQAFNDVVITESDWEMIDRTVALRTGQNVELIDTNQELNDVDITVSDFEMIDWSVALRTDQNVYLATAINNAPTDKDLHKIDVDVAIDEAAAFDVIEGDMTHVDETATEEAIAEMAMADLKDEQNIDPFVYTEDGVVGWADLNESFDAELNESYDALIQERQQASQVPIINEDLHKQGELDIDF